MNIDSQSKIDIIKSELPIHPMQSYLNYAHENQTKKQTIYFNKNNLKGLRSRGYKKSRNREFSCKKNSRGFQVMKCQNSKMSRG